jgi:phosphohistidine phosphatase SixA
MKTLQLYWFRHGAAEMTRPGEGDADRRLTPEGIKEVRFVAENLKRLALHPDFIFHSPLTRAKETSGIIARILERESKVQELEGLLPEDDWEKLRTSLKAHMPFKQAMLVGHQPSSGQTIGHVIGHGENIDIPLQKAGVAGVEICSLNREPYGDLLWLLNPGLLRSLRETK